MSAEKIQDAAAKSQGLDSEPRLDGYFMPTPVTAAFEVTCMRALSNAQKIGLALAVIGYIIAGTLHFIKAEAYLKIMPPYIPFHPPLVYISGVFEILGGLGLLLPQTRRMAAWGLIALLIAVFPANIYMATNPIDSGAASIPPALLWGRLALQPLLAWWILWCTKSRPCQIRHRTVLCRRGV